MSKKNYIKRIVKILLKTDDTWKERQYKMNYKELIVELLPKIKNEKWLKRIYLIVLECKKEEEKQHEKRNHLFRVD